MFPTRYRVMKPACRTFRDDAEVECMVCLRFRSAALLAAVGRTPPEGGADIPKLIWPKLTLAEVGAEVSIGNSLR